jgi:class 3 adenylate cyclase
VHRRRTGDRGNLRARLRHAIHPAAPEPRPRLSEARINYWPRIVGSAFFVLMLVSFPGDDFYARLAFAPFAFIYPHVAYWIAAKRGGDRQAETPNVLADSFLGGILVVAFSFRLWPVTAIYAIGVINALLYGGPKFLLLALAASVLGMAGGALLLSVNFHLDTEPLAIALSIVAVFSYVILIGTTAYRLRLRQRQTRAALKAEERRSQELLGNVFPRAIIPRLRAGESPIADQFADVTVVFADIVEFTPLAERLGPKRTVLLLNDLFGRFDQAAARLGVEKIETTGDGYLAMAGAPEPLDHHPEAVARFALEVLVACRETRTPAGDAVQLRIGIHTGPIFAGVIGESRFHYKIFGETVNTASRVQSHAQHGRILVSENTYKRLHGKFRLEEHGVVELKGHGPMRAYWLVP